jgi:hypothetical protein
MDLLKELNDLLQSKIDVTEAIYTGERAAKAAYEDVTSEFNEKIKLLTKRLKDHEKEANQKPNLKSVGQMINVNKLIDQAIKALNTI